MNLDKWVTLVNKLARKMDSDCEGVHPTAWSAKDREEYRRLAGMLGEERKA